MDQNIKAIGSALRTMQALTEYERDRQLNQAGIDALEDAREIVRGATGPSVAAAAMMVFGPYVAGQALPHGALRIYLGRFDSQADTAAGASVSPFRRRG